MPLTNGYNPKQLENYLLEIDAADARLAVLKSEYMNKCKGPREDIAAIYEASKDAGIPQRAFKTLVKNRRLDRQIEDNRSALESDDYAELEALEVALGPFLETPLGQAAQRREAGEHSLDTLA